MAKGVITGPDQFHIAYVHSPMRYAWDMQHDYLRETKGLFGLKRALARPLLHYMRMWDSTSGLRPNAIVANSGFIARRIRKTFGREAFVIHPPVDVTINRDMPEKSRHFLVAGRLVGYKNVRAVVDAFRLLPELELVVAGEGPDADELKRAAGPNVSFTGYVGDGELRRLMATAKALVFAAEEDFGIVPVEAQAEGTPVLALGRGGARETVVADGARPTGMFFEEASAPAIAACVNAFLANSWRFSRDACQAQALKFTADRFRDRFTAFVGIELDRWRREITTSQTQAAAPPLLAAAE